jgi:rubrerythrin
MKHIDARYRKSWGEPLVEDLRRLSSIGMEAYLSAERIRWTCPVCGARRSIHSRECSSCQTPDSRFSKAENNENERSQ